MPPRRKCFLGCVPPENQQLTLFAFPVKHVDRCESWLKALNLNYDTSSKKKEYVCHQHFPPDCFHSRMYPHQRLNLQSDAVPTLSQVCILIKG